MIIVMYIIKGVLIQKGWYHVALYHVSCIPDTKRDTRGGGGLGGLQSKLVLLLRFLDES